MPCHTLSPLPSALAPCVSPSTLAEHTWQSLLAQTLHGTAHPQAQIMWDKAISSPVNIINYGRGWVRNTKDVLPVHCPPLSLPRPCCWPLHNHCPVQNQCVWGAPSTPRAVGAENQPAELVHREGDSSACWGVGEQPQPPWQELWSLQTISHQ